MGNQLKKEKFCKSKVSMKLKTTYCITFLLIILLYACGSFNIEGGVSYNGGNYDSFDNVSQFGTKLFLSTGWYQNKDGDGVGVKLNYQSSTGYIGSLESFGFGTGEIKYKKLIGKEGAVKYGYSFGLGGGLTLREGGTGEFDILSGSGEFIIQDKTNKFYGLLRSKHHLNLGRLEPSPFPRRGGYNHSLQAGFGLNF